MLEVENIDIKANGIHPTNEELRIKKPKLMLKVIIAKFFSKISFS
jgi:hypothetical protein